MLLNRWISFIVAILLALGIEYFYAFTHLFLIPVSAIVVMLTPIGSIVYHGLIRLFCIIILVVLFSILFPPYHMVYERLYDVLLGGVIGISINLMVLPRHIDQEFRLTLLPLLKAYEAYFSEIMHFLFKKNSEVIDNKKIIVEKELQNLPLWVYASRFDVGLKKGHQYFLMKTFHMAEILFAMHHQVRMITDEELLEALQDSIEVCSLRIQKFFLALHTVFELRRLQEGLEDFDIELKELDHKFQSMMPVSLELLDMSREDISFYAFIYSLIDLRKALIKLAQALR